MRRSVILSLGLLLALACAPRAQQAQPIVIEPAIEEEKDTTAPKVEIEVVEEVPPAEEAAPTSPQPVAAIPKETPKAESAPAPPTAVYGFRVQVFAGNYNNALKLKALLEKELDEAVYVEFIPPYYKVRVGDFLTREQAQAFLAKLKALGYTDAFIVESEIQAR